MKRGKLEFQVEEEDVEFNLNEMEKFPSFTNHVYSIDTVEKLSQELSRVNFYYNPLELHMMGLDL